ncbi:sigma factor-like helix-turn-helix DNA-binding protein [Streptomyces sp. NPDC051577]|uniref:RNA polymerase sigma factor n=1 Tax=Streptomyces sp. NPDC051577 TaxID=3155166 RepID=UPI0034402D6C
MNVTTRHRAGTAPAALPAVDGLAHLYWATGATWPASDERALSLAVLGTRVSFGPPVVLPPAAITLTGAAAVLAHARGRGGPATRLVTAAVAARARPAELADVPGRGDPQLAADIDDVLARLSPDHRTVLVLRDVEGLDEESAAALFGVPPGTAKSRLHRARTSFRKAWSS